MARFPLVAPALRHAVAATALIAMGAFATAAVRLLPWVLDPDVPLDAAKPFARVLLALATETAVLVGWPVGWALAAQRAVDRGEALALRTLGERPARTVLRLWPQALTFTVALGVVAYSGARDAAQPGRMAMELVQHAQQACRRASGPASFAVPFVGISWLCAGGEARLVGRTPGALGPLFTARGVAFSPDLVQADLVDARVAFGERTQVHVSELHLSGLPGWGHRATLSATWRSVSLALAGVVSAACSVGFVLLGWPRRAGRLAAMTLGASGPLAVLALVRIAERWTLLGSPLPLLLALPLAASAAPALAAVVVARLLREKRAATHRSI